MKLREQLLSPELAKKLFDKGVRFSDIDPYQLVALQNTLLMEIESFYRPSVPELLEIMPKEIEDQFGDYYELAIIYRDGIPLIKYINDTEYGICELNSFYNPKLADALGECLLWLIENGYYEVGAEYA